MNRRAISRELSLGLAILAVAAFALPAIGSAAPVHLTPRPLVTGIVLVTEAGFTGGTDGTSVDATLTATIGDTLYALGSEGFAVGTPAFNDSLSLSWTVNATLSVGGFGFVIGVANVTGGGGTDTVTFADASSGALALTVWDVSGSAGSLAHVGAGSTGTGTIFSDSVEVDNASAFIGIVDVAHRATGGTSDPDTNLSYATHGSISASDGLGALWATPPNGTGVLPLEIGTNASTTQADWAFSIDPASAPPFLTAAISSFGPSPCEVGSCGALFNGTAAGGVPPYNFSWAWGDGSADTNDTGNVTGLDSTAHTFAAAGSFNVTLTVTDSLGANSTVNVTQVVVPTTLPAITTNVTSPCVVATVNDSCAVDFNTSLSFGLPSYSVEFLLLNATGAVVDSSFGNSSSTSAFNATFPETLPLGTYQAWLNVTDGSGHAFSVNVTFAVELPGAGGGGLISGGTFDLLLIGIAVGVLAIALVGAAGASRRRRGPR